MTREQFIDLVKQEQGPLRRFLCALCGGDGFRADDLAQEALLKAYLSYTKFEGRAKFSTWLFRIAYNCFYDSEARGRRMRTESLDALIEKRWGESSPDNGAEQPDAPNNGGSAERYFAQTGETPADYESIGSEQLYRAIGALSEKEKTVTLLFYMEEKSLREITAITGIKPATVRSHLLRARRHLRKYLTTHTEKTKT